jgi:hypothetical protein
MKTRDFDVLPRRAPQPAPVSRGVARRPADGMGLGPALLGVACVLGLFAVLALLFHLG